MSNRIGITSNRMVMACRSKLLSGLLAGLITLTLSSSVVAQWRQWGGAHQDFTAASTGIAPQWPADGPKELWTRELGDGYSAILVDEGRLYTMYRKGKREYVIAMDAATGKTIWEHKNVSSPAKGHAVQFGSGPRATPLLSGDFIYAIGVAGKMVCLNKQDGKKIWTVNLWRKFKGDKKQHGYSSSPIEYADSVIVLVGGKNASIVSLNKSDGKVVWKSHDFKNSYSSPKIISVDGEDQLVTFMDSALMGLDPVNGEMKWQMEVKGTNVCQPIWDKESGILFYSSAGAGAQGLKLTLSGGKTDVTTLWENKKVQFYHVNSVAIGDHIYGASGTRRPNFFAAINFKTGKLAWRERGYGKATCVYADGRLIILDDNGEVSLTTATPEALTVHSKAVVLEEVSWTVPTVVGTHMYVRDLKTLKAFNLG